MIRLSPKQKLPQSATVYKYDSDEKQGLYSRVSYLERQIMYMKKYGVDTTVETGRKLDVKEAHEFFEGLKV